MDATIKLLKVLFNMDKHLDEFQSNSDLSKEFIDSFFEIREISISDVYEEIISNSKDHYHLNELTRLVPSIRKSIKIKEESLNRISFHSLLKSALLPYEDEIKRIHNKIRIYQKRVNELSNSLEVRSFIGGEDIQSIEKEYEEAQRIYKQFQQVLKDAYDKHDVFLKENTRMLGFSFKDLDELLQNFEKRLVSINDLTEDNKRFDLGANNPFVKQESSESIFISAIVSSYAHSLFIQCGFIEEVDPSSFYKQLSQLEKFRLRKQPRKDKYIAYAISQLSQYVKTSKSKEWKSRMADNFEINHYEKVSKVKESKNEMHERIDEILSGLKTEKDSIV